MTNINQPDEYDIVRSIVAQLKDLTSDEQKLVIRWACEKLGIIPSPQTSENPNVVTSTASLGTPDSASVNIKSFVEEKDPQSDIHFAVVVAYYYRFMATERKDAISADDLQEATRLCGRSRLTKPAKTMNNAASTGLLDNVGRGLYRVNTVGENLVAIILPGDGGVATIKRKPKKSNGRGKVVVKKKK